MRQKKKIKIRKMKIFLRNREIKNKIDKPKLVSNYYTMSEIQNIYWCEKSKFQKIIKIKN